MFFRTRAEYRKILHISPYSAQMREYMDQKYSEYEHFSRSVDVAQNWLSLYFNKIR